MPDTTSPMTPNKSDSVCDCIYGDGACEKHSDTSGQALSGEIIEKLAKIEHERWASWQNYLHSFLTWNKDIEAWVLPHEWKDRWQMQVNTPYSMLSEKEKQSDRDQVMRYWPLITAHIQAVGEEIIGEKQ